MTTIQEHLYYTITNHKISVAWVEKIAAY